MLWRILLPAASISLSVWLGVFIIKNSVANLLIAYGVSGEHRREAFRLAPDNPHTASTLGKYLLYRAENPEPEEAVALLQHAVLKSPRDYRFRLELGRAYENTGQLRRAQLAMKSSVDLAPLYFEPRWNFANMLLRSGQVEEAVIGFREAIILSGGSSGRIDEKVAQNAYEIISGALGMNISVLRSITPSDARSQAALAGFLAGNGALDTAVEIWRELGTQDVESYRNLTVQILRDLQAVNRFEDAREVSAGLEKLLYGQSYPASRDNKLITNPGFELIPLHQLLPELTAPPAGFDWIIRPHPETRATRIDRVSHSGTYSLHLSFPATMSSDFMHIQQIVAVTPGKIYTLSYFIKTRNVSGLLGEVPFVEIVDAAAPGKFSIRSPSPSGTNDWREQSLSFSVPDTTYGLMIRIRAPKLVAIDVSRLVELWYDDFSLESQRLLRN